MTAETQPSLPKVTWTGEKWDFALKGICGDSLSRLLAAKAK